MDLKHLWKTSMHFFFFYQFSGWGNNCFACFTCTPVYCSVAMQTMPQWLLQQVAWHWFDIQGHANIMRPGRVQQADADRWPHQLKVRALKCLENAAYWLLCTTSNSIPEGDWKDAKQWEGSILLELLMWMHGCLILWGPNDDSIVVQIPNEINSTLKVVCYKLITSYKHKWCILFPYLPTSI